MQRLLFAFIFEQVSSPHAWKTKIKTNQPNKELCDLLHPGKQNKTNKQKFGTSVFLWLDVFLHSLEKRLVSICDTEGKC